MRGKTENEYLITEQFLANRGCLNYVQMANKIRQFVKIIPEK